MSNSGIAYKYDGSFYGMLCCARQCMVDRHMPEAILSPSELQLMMYTVVTVNTDVSIAANMQEFIVSKVGKEGLCLLKESFLTCLEEKELRIIEYILLSVRYGRSLLKMLSNETVHALESAVRHMEREAHLLKGFLRFSQRGEILWAEMEPKNFVLPILSDHFSRRFPKERFIICDLTHNAAVYYFNGVGTLVDIPRNMPVPQKSQREPYYESLWKMFYETIEIEGRHNPKCRRSLMPKRYWGCTVELGR